jgi:ribosomal protein S21
MRSAQIKVKLDETSPCGTKAERDSAFKKMHSAFKTQVNKSGILVEWKQRQHFESKSQKRRRKRKQAEIQKRKEAMKQRYRGTQ